MDIFNGFKRQMGLAMAGKSPWGGGKGGGSNGSGDDGGDGGGEGGPRNPWLPGGSKGAGDNGGDKPSDGRRSASIEDIFKNRGPEGPNRGGGPRGPNFNFPKRSGGKSWMPLIIIGVLAVGIFMTSTHLVGPKEQGVVKTLGNFTRTMNPGLNFSAPYPIEVVDIEDVQGVRALNIPGSSEGVKLILTGDQNLVDLSYIVRWNIKNLEQFKFRLVQPEETVAEVAEAAMRASIAEKELDETFSGQGRAAIEQNVRERMQEVLDSYEAGIQVLGVEIEKADPPAEVVDAFRDVQVAEQNADAARNQAQGYAQQVLAQAEGQAQAFDKVYEEYRLAPRVTRQRLYYETMERVLSGTDKTIIETEGVTPYLPLPEIRKRATGPQPITAPQPQSGGN
ncbi:MAG: protease modulator HflK [Erythrobacter sp.]